MSSCGNESGLVVRGTRTGGRTDILSVPLQKQQGQDGPATHGQDAHATFRRRGGFTLIELLLVLVILGILATIVVPKFTARTEQAKIAKAVTQISNFKVALNMFEVDCGRYPTTEEGLGALTAPPANIKGWKQSYLEGGVPKDPWENPYEYRCPGAHNADGYDIFSYGPDGVSGTDDDVDNWTTK